FGIGAPGDFEAGTFDVLCGGAIVLWRERITFADHHGGDALAELAFGTDGIEKQWQAAAAHHVDEAGRDDGAAGVDGAARGMAGQAADFRDDAVANANVGDKPGIAGAVDDAASDDEDVERFDGETGLRARNAGCESKSEHKKCGESTHRKSPGAAKVRGWYH